MELKQLGPDVYAALQEDKGLGWSNSGLIGVGGGVVVDTFWDLPKTRALIDAYASVLPRPAERLVNTHHNGDHCWGNQLFEGAEIIGHRLCAEGMAGDVSPAMMSMMAAQFAEQPGLEHLADAVAEFDFSGIEITPPTTVFDERLHLDLDGLGVELIYVGPAHTQGDVVVHVPERNVVFTGDVLFRLCTPIGWEGTTERWVDALQTVIDLEADIVVPGHGPLTDADGCREMQNYLRYVAAESKTFFEAGLSEIEAAKKLDLGPYADWTEPARLIFNVHRAYRELRGEPWDAPLNVPGMFQEMGELHLHWH